MKKYNTPELTISSFDVEDIITASGEMQNGMIDFVDGGLAGYVSATKADATVYDTGAYFGWDAH